MNGYWYAVQKNVEDDWGTGSFDRGEAVKMAAILKANGYNDALVAVIDNAGDPVCVEEIDIDEEIDHILYDRFEVAAGDSDIINDATMEELRDTFWNVAKGDIDKVDFNAFASMIAERVS